MQPLSYQSDCLTALSAARRKRRQKALVVMATGLGKTVVSAFDIRRLLEKAPGRVLYLCHQNDILRQARETFEEILGASYSYGYFHGTEKHLHRVDVLFASFQTMATWRDAFRKDEFRYVVVDEVHHAHAATFRPTIEYFTPDFLVGLTATPERADGLDIRELFGKPVYELGLFKALAGGHLCEVDYRVMTDEIQNAGVLDTPAGKLSIAELNRTIFIPKRDEEIMRIIGEKVKEVQNPRVMIFCNSIAHAERMAALIPHAAVVHSKLKQDEKRRRLDAFRCGDVDTVLTVDMLNEGIDVPQANVIVFLRSTQSKTIFLQQLGRGLRKALGKLKVLVLDFVANCERIEMIDDLMQGTKQALGDLPPAITTDGDGDDEEDTVQHSPMTLTLDGVAFDERVLKLFDVIRDVRGGYTKEMLIEQLHRKAKELGRVPSSKEMGGNFGLASAGVFYRVFQTQSWNVVLQETGLTPINVIARPRGKVYTKAELTEQLLAKARELGRTPTRRDVTGDLSNAPISAFSAVFGTQKWSEITKAVGLMPTRQVGVTEAELTEQLLAKARELGRTPKIADVTADPNMPSVDTFVEKFATGWGGVLRCVGLAANTRLDYTKAELTEQLLAKARELGRTPSSQEVAADPDMASIGAFRTTFSASWSGVLIEVGLKPLRAGVSSYTVEELTEQLLAKARELGRVPKQREVTSDPRMASGPTFIATFGLPWDQILESVGFSKD